jgi:hypothetical protein
MADVNDPFGTNHPGAIAILAVSTLSTFGAMYWLHCQNAKDHERLQTQLDALNSRLTTHEHDNTRHLNPASLILPVDEVPALRSPRPVFSS